MTKSDDMNADLTRRINEDLRAKAEGTSKTGGKANGGKRAEDPDLVEDSEYAKDFNKTSRFAWVWIVLGIAALAILIGLGISKH